MLSIKGGNDLVKLMYLFIHLKEYTTASLNINKSNI